MRLYHAECYSSPRVMTVEMLVSVCSELWAANARAVPMMARFNTTTTKAAISNTLFVFFFIFLLIF